MSRNIALATRVRITAGGKSILATLASSEAARDFASLLPLRLAMNDLFRREKFAPLPRAISENGTRTHVYAVGTIGYWPPGPDVAIFYRQDGERIPDPGLIVLAKVTTGIEALNVRGPIEATIELAQVAAMGEAMAQQHIQIAEIEVDPTQLESYKSAVQEQIEAAIRLEPGVLVLYSVSNKDNPTHVTVFEIYGDRDASSRI